MGLSVSAYAQVLIEPVFVEMGPRHKVAAVAVTLSKAAPQPVRLQVDLLRWTQNLQGQSVTRPTNELLVTPPIADLQPGDKQVFRVALRGARPRPGELAYRLILEDVAKSLPDASAEGALQVKFRMRYDLPVLVAPVGKVTNALQWTACPPAADTATAVAVKHNLEACVRMRNAGNRRVKVQTLTLTGDGWRQALMLKDGEILLAGSEREWRVPMAANQTAALHGVQVLTTRGETLQAEAGAF